MKEVDAMRVVLILLLLVTALAVNTHSQVTPASSKASPAERSLGEIKQARPEVSYDTLFKDVEAVEASRPAIQYIYSERGFDRGEADAAALLGWKILRTERLGLAAPLSPKELINYVSGLGKLVIKSTPTGAAIELNGDKMTVTTDAVQWPSAGSYRIRLSLSGYETLEEVFEVKEGTVNEFKKTLTKVKKKK